VLVRSEETALRIYEKEFYDAEGGSGSNGWDTLARKWNKGALMAGGLNVGIGALHRAVYKAVHKWRDAVAREDDESIRYSRILQITWKILSTILQICPPKSFLVPIG
jgi:exosome complex exonuclease RRP6